MNTRHTSSHNKITAASPSFSELKALLAFSQPLFTLRKKTTLITDGEKFKGLYLVHSGLLKQSQLKKTSENEIITHFFFPGDLIGLDSIFENHYSGSIASIETCGLSLIKFHDIANLPITKESHIQLLRILSKSMRIEHTRLWRTLSQSSDSRLAYFFITMSSKFREQGYSPNSFRLPMSRQDIANYLCMASETVSRIVSRFENEGLLEANGHEYLILNPRGLADIAEKA
ncbi:Crp/Fnr family transcriptional regulator [Vreelandella alkaliphila]|uniref:Crp/Fnr family transcriptional regulator n=1 Tax=Vreelandella alkaliphila TaxID=272774 RepID=UPI000EA3FF2D|nr:Crp/Fnr family transcriptional regulator [Halomonas alkaliphila]AYF35039.1 Crp/Fnr family transcriptional regulator [Halomonas alkaliphila]